MDWSSTEIPSILSLWSIKSTKVVEFDVSPKREEDFEE
jgi:hypothetical protein